MLKRTIRLRLAAFGRKYGYDVAYLEALLDADADAVLRFGKVQKISEYRKDVTPAVSYAAKIVGTLAEDCGPCTQLMVTMAEREGVSAATLRAVLAADDQAMDEDIRLTVRFCRAVLDRDPQADDLREDIIRRWGKRGLVSIGFGLVAARLYPTLKYALGYGKACSHIKVGD
ncbi:MAG: hypothetical protein OXU20_40335, partial [Myxococcales bacterium]|nr:hypothetical protein [Myxococcales bacterium]